MAREMRLQRFLAQAGVASRRHAEELIVDGKVRVNGRVVTELGTRVDPARDKVVVSGRRVVAARHAYILLCKPRGTVATVSDPEGRPTVLDLIRDRPERLYPIGRLDFHTDGVLLLTNDGDLANALMHPRREIEKVYHVKLHGVVAAEALERLRAGVRLDDGRRTAPSRVQILASTGKHTWLEITIHEWRNRQIHRMAEAVGHEVLKLSRVGYAGLTVDGLKPGEWRPLRPDEVEALRRRAGLGGGPEKAPPRGSRSRKPVRRR